MSIAARLTELGISLPEPAKAVANYVPFVRSGNLLHISGQLSNDASGGIKGTVGADVSPDQAQAGARLCGVNLLAQMSAALDGDLERVVRVVKLGGFVQHLPSKLSIGLCKRCQCLPLRGRLQHLGQQELDVGEGLACLHGLLLI